MGETGPDDEVYRQLAEGLPDVLFRASADATIEWVAPSVMNLLGWRPEELIGRHAQDLLHPDEGELLRHANREIAQGHPHTYEARFPTVTGAWRWMAVSVRPVRDAEGIIVGRIGTLRDAQESVTQREALLLSERHYRMLAENASDVVYERDLVGTVVWVSPSIETALGWTPEEVVGKRAIDFVHPDDIVEVLRRRARIMAGDAETTNIVRYRDNSGGFHHMSATSRPVRDASGTFIGAVVSLRDVDALLTVQAELRDALAAADSKGEQLQSILDAQLDPNISLIAVRDESRQLLDLRFADANQPAVDYFGLPREELQAATLRQVRPMHADNGLLDHFFDVVETGETLMLQDFAIVVDEAAGIRYVDVRAVKLGDGLTVSWRDVTDQHHEVTALVESEEHHRLLAANAGDVIVHTSAGQVRWISSSITASLGWDPAELVGRDLGELIHDGDGALVEEAREDVHGDHTLVNRLRALAADGSHHWIETHSHSYIDADGRADGTLTTFRVIDNEVAAQESLDYQARHDELTGLLNRKEVLSHLAENIAQMRRTADATAVLFCDVDRFKSINDNYGHLVGDDVLQTIAQRVCSCVRANDSVARLGGDELLVVLHQVNDLDNAMRIAQSICATVDEAIMTAEGLVHSTLSIGLTMAIPGDTVDDIIGRADNAMYEAKRTGRNRVVPF